MAPPHQSLIDIGAGRVIRPVADSADFVESAVDHRMAGLAFWASCQQDFGLEASAKQALAAHKLQATAQTNRLVETLREVLAMLDQLGIEAAVFKGVATESRWYPEPGTRPAADIDMFISPEAHGRLDELVDVFHPGHALAGAAQRLHDAGQLQGFDVGHNGVWIDFHTDPIKVGVPIGGYAEMWERTILSDLGGVECRVLDTDTSVLQAVLHLQKDRFSHLQGYVDVARMTQGPVDWDWVQRFAVQAGLGVHLNEGLRVVGDVLDLELPHDSQQTSRVWRRVWPEDSRLLGSTGMTRRVRTKHWIPFMMKGRRLEALKWWSRILVPPPEMISYLHPEVRGPYLWKLVTYRARLAWSRHKRNVAQRRSGAVTR